MGLVGQLYHRLQHIAIILSGKTESTLLDIKKTSSLEEITKFKYAPIMSIVAEHYFSQYKSILRSNRESFLFSNLKMVPVIQYNGRIKFTSVAVPVHKFDGLYIFML